MARPKRKERKQSDDDEDYREVESEYEEDDQTIQRKKNSKKNLKSKRKRQDKVEESETEEEEEEETSAKKIAKKHSKEKGKKQKVKHREDLESEEETTPKKDNKKNLSPRTLDLLRQTPFGNIVDVVHGGHIEEKSAKKSDDFITLLLQAYNHENDLFFFRKKKFRISIRDISKILGLPAKVELVPKTSEARINKKAVEKALQVAINDKPTTEEGIEKKDKNVARLILLDLSIKFLFPNAGGTISWDYVRACENLDQIGSYDWAKEVGSFLKKSIKALEKKNSKSSYGNMGGCVLIILVGYCHTEMSLVKKYLKKMKEDREESESEEEENSSDEAKIALEGEEKGDDDQEVEVAEQETASEKGREDKMPNCGER
ncbi:DNA ligase 1-like [Rosa chinensis]|uniref:DNA ligase 1-like n=1 Tax=Rosa chinensis TaxID=74649 RepID=UPI001AD8C434|nr:DNA ligase 1-like [Rosa chinensis]